MGRRIAAYTFTKIGEDKIFKNIEDALRDPEKAAVLIRRYRDLDKWEPPSKVKQLADDAIADPLGTAIGAKDRLSRAAGFVGKYLKGHSQESIERAVQFGLIPAQGEGRRITLEEDWRMGGGPGGRFFQLEDNRIRYAIENDPQYNPEARVGTQRTLAGQAPAAQAPAAQAPAARVGTQRTLAGQAPVQGSSLASANPLGTALFGANDPVFGLGFRHGGYVTGGAGSGVGRMEESGIMSVKRKPRQLVG
jgi:hypothetical protein